LLDPYNSIAFNECGVIYQNLNQLQQALTDLNQAIALNPGNADALVNRANTFLRLNQPQQAIIDLDQAIVLDPYDGITYNSRGDVYRSLKNYVKAEKEYKKAIQLNMYVAYYNLGLNYFLMGKPYHSIYAYLQGFLTDKDVLLVMKTLSIEDIISGRF
jgi:tetratricopeptide (TPR) repeat protein